ncbi:protein PHYLLO, chloroplastic isoform X8 [Rosa chinensis]|uniref:protein PHYLLO, chloroplastic isoform X8 n=1 Tax=Rosa chinensis TaxID=74649 RepID=UPI001AD91724|nr:protein PHYLLO, chloroplastic isoform X8 [Rosa chinensis]
MLLLTNSLSFLHSNTRSLPHTKPSAPPPFPFLHPNSRHLRLPPNSKVVRGVRFDGPAIDISQVTHTDDGDLIIETCLTRNLTPALSIEQGLESIKEAVEELKLHPPSTCSGILRFQVAVPPSAKALNWFCCQPESSAVYPLFFVSKETENPSYKSLYVNETRGVFGIGAAIYFTPSSNSSSSIKRILSNESAFVIAYGFMDINYDQESSYMKHEPGSYYFFIPQIELHEHEGASVLAATIGWSESSLCTFEEAVLSYELCFNQVTCQVCSTTKKSHTTNIRSTLRKLNLLEDGMVSMVHMNMLLAGGKNILSDIMALVSPLPFLLLQKEAPSSSQFCVRLSPTMAVANKMLDHASKMCFSVQDCGNINTVWASLIVEECSRLGLTYFCVAPGSRSSPLAVAASTHPLITCIVCYDERSLAFHAVGYARGSGKPAVIITSSGTAVSNLLPAVVEASQDFVPLILLTADRPAELQDAGANQAINQIGSRITSKRIAKMLEESFPCSYIMVDKHPFRHDPSHIVTHRVHSNIFEFADYILKAEFPHLSKEWSTYLQMINAMVERELSFQISARHSLTEPQVAYLISEALSAESALFIGNSMAIRDADMYGRGWSEYTRSIVAMNYKLPCQMIRVAGNRGASGIDGLLSTAVGFAVGCNKRVLCVIGDVSFLHDTNGLAIVNQRTFRKPMTIVVINNHGGAIFSLLPLADRVRPRILNQYFYTSHNISIRELCVAHGVMHLHATTKLDFEEALFTSQHGGMDCVIEVESCIDTNASFHSTLKTFACQAADQVIKPSSQDSILDGTLLCRVHRMEYSLFRMPLCAPHTMVSVDGGTTSFHREGFILTLYFEDGSFGLGEVSPLDIYKENLLDVEEQLRFLIHMMKGSHISCFLPLLKGSFSSWIWSNLGILPCTLFPSVRCGLEMAILNAIANRKGSNLLGILHPQIVGDIFKSSSTVQICALVDSSGTPTQVADAIATLVEEGFTAVKIKVARCGSPLQDAAVIQEVRKKVGYHIKIRADANRNWTYDEAIQFGSLVKDCDLQYIEEPVQIEEDIIKFCKESGLPVALDETIDNIGEHPLIKLSKYAHPGIVAVVIKPSVVGGFENAAIIAQWAQQHQKMAVVSAAFESSLGLSAYIQFSCYLNQMNSEICTMMNYPLASSIAHGLGTYRWLKEDLTTTPLKINRNPRSGFVEASVADSDRVLQQFQINGNIIHRRVTGEQVCIYQLPLDSKGLSCSIKIQEIGQGYDDNVFVFLHGFLGTGEDWIAIMKALSGCGRCVSIDLPGHGGTKIQSHGDKDAVQASGLCVEVVADLLCKVIEHITPGKVTLVGYSMGARIALCMALKLTKKVKGAIIISGSPGLNDGMARKIRRAEDDSRARFLVAYGLKHFLDTWYAGELWNSSLREHPHFHQIAANRLHHGDVQSLAKVLSALSVGRQLPLWEDLKHCKTPLLLIVGEKDKKFKTIAQDMFLAIGSGNGKLTGDDGAPNDLCEIVEIPDCGHAAHLENPLPVIRALRQFVTKLN